MNGSRDEQPFGQPEPDESPFLPDVTAPASGPGAPPPLGYPPQGAAAASPPPRPMHSPMPPYQPAPPYGWQGAPPPGPMPPPSRPPVYQPAPPPKKSKAVKFLAIGIILLFIVGVFGLMMLLGLATSLPGLGSSIAMLEVEGPIYTTRKHLEFVQDFEKKDNWKAMVIRIESPGGASSATQELFDEIVRVKNTTGKPVVVSMGNTAASGGYYLALAGDKVYATPSTLTGSIGVIMSIPNIEELLDKIGYQPRTIKSGEFKDMGDYAREWTPEERALIQGLIDNVFEQFLDDVVAARRQAISRAIQNKDLLEEFPDLAGVLAGDTATTSPVEWFARQVCDGRVFTGEQALDYGFVDAIGGLPDAVRYAEEQAGLKHPANIVSSKKPPTLMDVLTGNTQAFLGAFGPRHPILQFRWTLP